MESPVSSSAGKCAADSPCYIPPMAFDPHQRPMSLEESDRLLRGAENWEATKRGWGADLAIWSLFLVAVAAGGLAFFGIAAVAGSVVAVIAFVVAVLLWHNHK